MIAMVVAGIVAAATYSAYRLQVKVSAAQNAVTQMQQNLRSGMSMLMGDIRMAGYDPNGSGNFGFVSGSTTTGFPSDSATNSTKIAFTVDIDSDGTVDTSVEDYAGDGDDMSDMEPVAYKLEGMQLLRYSNVSGAVGWQAVAEDIENIEFQYLDEDGTVLTPTTAQLSLIQTIKLSVLARAEQRDAGYVNDTTYNTASGATWGPFNDNYRRRLYISTIECRNMGL